MSQEIIKTKLKELEKLEQEYSKNESIFRKNNDKIESFLKAIISKEERCLKCDECEIQHESRKVQTPKEYHKFVKGFKNDIVKSCTLLTLNSNTWGSKYIDINNYELAFVKTYSSSPADTYNIIDAWNYQDNGGSYWYREDILKIFEGDNLSKIFETLKEEIINSINYRNRYIQNSSEKVKRIDRIIDVLDELK